MWTTFRIFYRICKNSFNFKIVLLIYTLVCQDSHRNVSHLQQIIYLQMLSANHWWYKYYIFLLYNSINLCNIRFTVSEISFMNSCFIHVLLLLKLLLGSSVFRYVVFCVHYLLLIPLFCPQLHTLVCDDIWVQSYILKLCEMVDSAF